MTGDTALRCLRWRNTVTGEVAEYRPPQGDTFGVFVFAGYEPATDLVRGLAELDVHGYVHTGRDQCAGTPGLYAAGDVCAKPLRQVVTAVGEGALAATELEKYAAQMQQKTGLRPQAPKTLPGESAAPARAWPARPAGGLFDAEMLAQLEAVFSKMQQPLVLRLFLRDDALSAELRRYMQQLAELTNKLSVQIDGDPQQEQALPGVRVCRADGTDTGLAFHGVPGGHEFTSFVLGLYNAAGPGQALDAGSAAAIQRLGDVHMKVLVSLSCTMCPELVTAAQRIAAANPQVTADVYDLNHFPALREKYQVMSVPCLVVDDEKVSFGKKNVHQLLEFLGPDAGGPEAKQRGNAPGPRGRGCTGKAP